MTDADLLLGYLDAAYFLGGEMQLQPELAAQALGELGRAIDRDVTSTAWGIHDIVNESMASAARVHFAERGRDPRTHTIVATGGAGPVHAYELARKLGIGAVLCPIGSGVASSLGLLVARPHLDLTQSYSTRLTDIDWARLNRICDDLEQRSRDFMASIGVADADVNVAFSAEMRYLGQGFEVLVPVPPGPYRDSSRATLREAFEATYRTVYHHDAPGVPVELLTWRLRASGPPSDADAVALALRSGAEAGGGQSPGKGSREVYFAERRAFVTTPVFNRYLLPRHVIYDGPAIVEERESTVVVGPSARFSIDEHQTLVMAIADRGGGR